MIWFTKTVVCYIVGSDGKMRAFVEADLYKNALMSANSLSIHCQALSVPKQRIMEVSALFGFKAAVR